MSEFLNSVTFVEFLFPRNFGKGGLDQVPPVVEELTGNE